MIDALYIPGAKHFAVEVTVYRDWRYERHAPCTYHFWNMDDGMEFWKQDYRELDESNVTRSCKKWKSCVVVRA